MCVCREESACMERECVHAERGLWRGEYVRSGGGVGSTSGRL